MKTNLGVEDILELTDTRISLRLEIQMLAKQIQELELAIAKIDVILDEVTVSKPKQ